MKTRTHKAILLALFVGLAVTPCLLAQPPSLTYGEDYTVGDEVHVVTTVKVAPNRIDHYLAGLAKSWVPANEVSREMGLIKGSSIWVSELPNGGDFNVVLVVAFENAAQRDKINDPATFAEFERKVEEKFSEQESFQVTEGYTQIREIVGEYLMREVTLK